MRMDSIIWMGKLIVKSKTGEATVTMFEGLLMQSEIR